MIKKAILLLLIFTSIKVVAQAPVSATFGAGYKSHFGTVGIFIMGVDITDRLQYEIGPALNISYSGMGATTGFKYAFLKTRNYSASANLDYRFLFSRNISKLFESDKRFCTYQTPMMHHVFASASFNILMSKVSRSLGDDKLSFTAGYGYALSAYEPKLVGGEPNEQVKKNISRQISSGISFSISYTAYLFQ